MLLPCMIVTMKVLDASGGWWSAKDFDEIHGNVAIELSSMRYVHAMDNGLFCLGDSRDVGQWVIFFFFLFSSFLFFPPHLHECP